MDRPRHYASIAIRALLIAAIGLTLFVAYGLIDNAWYHVLAVRGGSMEPTITAGDLIVITRPPSQVEVGQVLTLQVDGAIVTHRVVEVAADGTFITQGDANQTRDDFSANDVHIVGEYRFSVPLIGILVDSLVSGAWVGGDDAVPATARAGRWVEGVEAIAVDPSTDRITWSAPSEPASTPTETAATAPPTPVAVPRGTPLATPFPTPIATVDPGAAASPSATPDASPRPATSDPPPPSLTPPPSEAPSSAP